MPDFSQRASGLEKMDDLQVTGPDLFQALRELDAINYVLGGNYVTLTAISKFMDEHTAGGKLHIADLGCGSGDMLRRIRRLLEKREVDADLTGVDANPNVIAFAQTHTPTTCRIRYDALNIFSEEFQKRTFDVITSTLFFHHFTDEELTAFLKKLKQQVRVGMIINDIHRHWFAYYAIKVLTRIFSRSPMVKHDAAVSVLRAFKKKELSAILTRAGLQNFKIRWCWAFRWQVIVWF